MSVVVVMYEPGMQRIEDTTEATAHAVTDAVYDDARRFCPIDTTELIRTIRKEKLRGKGRVWVGDHVNSRGEHWAPVEYGAQPHRITPKGPPTGKKALWWPGLPHPVGAVNHPGNAQQPFMRPALYRKRYLLFVNPRSSA